jgi:hypothetical protein
VKRLLVVCVLASLLALAAAVEAGATVKRVSLTTPVIAGSYASLSEGDAEGALHDPVIYDTVVSEAKGLGPKSGGTITWRGARRHEHAGRARSGGRSSAH